MNRSHIFLKCYRETGSVTKAADAAQINRSIHYRRLKEDPEYAAAFAEAQEVAVEVMEDEALRRAVDGVWEPVVYQGHFTYSQERDEKTGQYTGASKIPLGIRKYSDSMLQFLLRGAKPQKYRERFQVSGNLDVNVTKFKGSLEDLIATYRVLTAENDPPQA